jgi:catechol 2,3-dioxygenase-like lactoylglutathione lyase family enzyme
VAISRRGAEEAGVIDHVSIGVRSLERSTRFYETVLGAIGFSKLVVRPGTVGFGTRYAVFWLNARPGMAPIEPGIGSHIALRAKSAAEVDAFHRAALAEGGASDGEPGLRRYSKANVYAAFIRDPDGHRIEALVLVEREPSPNGDQPANGAVH